VTSGVADADTDIETTVLSTRMTIQTPDDLARGLADIAALQKKSVEQIAVENLRLLFDRASSPGAVLHSIRSLPHPSPAAVDDMGPKSSRPDRGELPG
jgi:hypothetical protein